MYEKCAGEEIACELNRKFGTKRTGDKYKKKMNYLIERYKIAKDWNSKQTGGHRRQSVFYEEIYAVLGCRDVVTLRIAKRISLSHRFRGILHLFLSIPEPHSTFTLPDDNSL